MKVLSVTGKSPVVCQHPALQVGSDPKLYACYLLQSRSDAVSLQLLYLQLTITSQYQLEMSQEENARKTAEIDALRNALATKGIELEASASGDLKLRTSLQLAIDAVLILDFYSEAVVLKYREMCNERGIEGTLLVSELSEIAKALPLGRQKTVISQVRDRVLAVNKALIDGLDNGLHHHGTCLLPFPLVSSLL